MYYGATAKKIRAYFKALRKAARTEGGAIGFIEEIDAIATAPRRAVGARAGGVVQRRSYGRSGGPAAWCATRWSARAPAAWSTSCSCRCSRSTSRRRVDRLVNCVGRRVNLLLPADRQIRQRKPVAAPILLIAATNRADSLDPALLRPGRFDRRLTFAPPDAHGRRALVDHFLARALAPTPSWTTRRCATGWPRRPTGGRR